MEDYPNLEQTDISACLAYDHALIAHERVRERRAIPTIDSNFRLLVFHRDETHTGIASLSEVLEACRMHIMSQLSDRYANEMAEGAILDRWYGPGARSSGGPRT